MTEPPIEPPAVTGLAEPVADRARGLVVTYPNAKSLHQATAARLLLALSDALALQDRADVALTGGRDGTAVLRELTASPLNAVVDWSHVHLWWGDERFVAADSADRNALQAQRAWFGFLVSRGVIAAEHVHQMPADTRTPEQIAAAGDDGNAAALNQAASEYDREILNELGEDPAFDVTLFGLGPDGHFASLFPDRPEVLIRTPDTRVVGVSHSPKEPPLRLSLTVPFIRRSHQVWMIASGSGKASAVTAALAQRDNPHVPSSFAAGAERTLWLVDRDAASRVA